MTDEKKPNSRALTITGYVLSVLAILFFLMDGVIKLAPSAEILEINKKLGFADSLIAPIAIILLISTFLYAIPQTSILGAILLSAYLGGAVATQLRVSAPQYNQGFGGEPFNIVFPVIIALFVWGGLYLREPRLRALIPFKTRG